ncbi:unnamed protein product, partial [Mesorhabditis belari]|uniref:Uncharacterized protein n=1 Tax=Mesorhabditis belari TaxID=2138241 RepID=A0AAF3J8Z2_9BILA
MWCWRPKHIHPRTRIREENYHCCCKMGKAKIGFAVFLVLDAVFLIFLGASIFLGTQDTRLPLGISFGVSLPIMLLGIISLITLKPLFMQAYGIIYTISLNLIISPLGIYFSATNNRLSLPIRLLATAENIIRFAYSVCYMPYIYCRLAPTYLLKKYQCGWPFYWFSMGLFDKIILYYPLYDMAQHCQLMISINRFFAVHFDGFLFRYTLKWPLVQVALPFVIRIAVAQVKISFFPPNLMEGGIYFDDYIVNFFNFLMCSLDFMTWRRMKALRRDGKITRSELLLLFQMLTFSFLIIANTIILNFTQNICSYFFGANVSELLYSTPYSFQAIFFVGINSITSVFFLRKPKEKPITSSIISVNTRTTNMRSH